MMAGGQSINDRLTAARYSIAGQGLAKSVCKATTEEVIGPKKKHLDYLLHCTNEPNVSIPQLANLLIERTGHSSWVVVFKALVTVHHLMCYGNERFTQYLASSNSSFQLGNFLDKSNVQGYDMSTFIRRYAKYLNEKALSYRTVAFDFCKIKRGKDDGILRTMNADKLLKTLPVLQSQIDALLEFDCTANELTNGIINSAFMLLFRDLIRLFACYNDGIINLLEKYFDMNKKMCRDALDIYKKFLIRMDRVAEFLKVAESMGLDKGEMPNMTENVGIDKGDIPDLAKLTTGCKLLPHFGLSNAPSSLLDALEQHLTALEGKKGSGAGTPTQPTVKPSYLNSAVTALSNTSSSFGSAAAGGRSEFNGVGMDDTVKKFALEEEQAALTQHRERRMKELAAQSPTEVPSGANTTNPFLTSPTSQEPVLDIFDSLPTSSPSTKTSDDLLCLKSNPFAESIINTSQAPPPSPFPNDFWGNQNGFSVSNAELTTSVSSSNIFVSDAAFDTVFGNNNNASTSGTTLTPVPAPEITVEQDVGRSGLDIPGLNPFANISSATPSPSGAPEVRGAGTTPILSGSDLQMFGTPFGESGIEAQKTGEEPESQNKMMDLKSSPVQPASSGNFFPDFDSGFGGQMDNMSMTQPFPQSVPAGGTKSFSSESTGPQADLFEDIGDFSLGPTSTSVSSQPLPTQQPPPQQQSASFGGFDFGMNVLPPVPPNLRTSATPSPSVSSVPSPARSVPTASALDDLNATIRAAMSGSPSRSVSAAGTPSAASDGGKADMGAFFSQPISFLPATSLPASNIDSGFGGGSPAKAAGSSALGTGFDALGDVLQPVSSTAQSSNQSNQGKMTATSKVITGDLDSSLAILAQNLDINRGASSLQKGGHVWNSPKNTTKTGGANWTPHIASSTASWNSPQHNFKPMSGMSGTAPTAGPGKADWSSGITSGFPPTMMQPQSTQFMGGPRPVGTTPNMNVTGGPMGMGMPAGVPLSGISQQPMFGAMHPTQPAAFGVPPTQPQSQTTTLDPFGVL